MTNQSDVKCMSRALHLAKRGVYTTRPNPNVGCVITNMQGDIIGEGFHQKAGLAHAEVNALQQAGDEAQGGTAYVTLEPCCHKGKTGPCTEALLEAGIKQVVIATRDPNPLVAGKGIQRLEQHGVQVRESVLEQQAIDINRGFFKRMQQGLPWITIKVASSVDGRTALSNGTSKWITSEQARRDVQTLRASHDAIMTGIGTLLADDPSLNVRLSSYELGIEQEVLQPTRIIIDLKLETPDNAKLLSLPGKTIIFTSSKQTNNASRFSNDQDCEVVIVDSMNDKGDKFNLHWIMEYLAKHEINSVLVEAGANLMGDLLNAMLVDELIHYVAPSLMGNPAKGMFDLPELEVMSQCVSLEYKDIRQVGKDLRITSKINY